MKNNTIDYFSPCDLKKQLTIVSIRKAFQYYLLFQMTVLNQTDSFQPHCDSCEIKHDIQTNKQLTDALFTSDSNLPCGANSPVSQASPSAAGRLLCDCCTSKQLSLTRANSVIKVSLLLGRRTREETVELECVKSACINVLALHKHQEHFNELHCMFPSNSTMVYVTDSRPCCALPLPASALD